MYASTTISTNSSPGLPEVVRIGPVDYRVILIQEPKVPRVDEDGKEYGEVPVFGMVSFKKSEIVIDSDLTAIMQWQCFWHEVLHVVFEQTGLDNHDESLTDAVAYKLLEILIDNSFLQFPARETPPSGPRLMLPSGPLVYYANDLAHCE